MQKLFLCLSVIGMILTGCSKNDDEDNGENEGKLPDLPALPDPDDVCSAMDDINFMSYCYENFDVNKDGKVSIVEANAVKTMDVSRKKLTSLKGIERFSNLEDLNCGYNPIEELDIRCNTKLLYLYCRETNINSLDISKNKVMLSISEFAFYCCTKLTSISLPENITVIGKQAFWECKKLRSIVLPKNLAKINYGAFFNCNSLEWVKCFSIEPPIIEDFNFYINNTAPIEATLYVPALSVNAYKNSRWGNQFSEISPIQ